jgi:hypothetical protein
MHSVRKLGSLWNAGVGLNIFLGHQLAYRTVRRPRQSCLNLIRESIRAACSCITESNIPHQIIHNSGLGGADGRDDDLFGLKLAALNTFHYKPTFQEPSQATTLSIFSFFIVSKCLHSRPMYSYEVSPAIGDAPLCCDIRPMCRNARCAS